jgi:hypothetical protein
MDGCRDEWETANIWSNRFVGQPMHHNTVFTQNIRYDFS